MASPASEDVDVERARELWTEYQKSHNVTDKIGQTVGIDPTTGRVWFGRRAIDIADQLDAEGIDRPLYFVRVGYDYYERKGGHR